jgi:UPF0271 protein
MLTIDINCDMGEGMDNDAELMPYITSANIACGGHAGDKDIMRRTIELCRKYNVAIGAHPSYPDKKNFGRIDMDLSPEKLVEIVLEQIDRLKLICTEFGAALHHIKLHGALYNRAARDERVSDVICAAIKQQNILLYGLSGSETYRRALAHHLPFANEVFADRTYQDDGSLTPRAQPNALIHDTSQAVRQALQMIKEKMVMTVSGKKISVSAETICIHGDGEHAVAFAKTINEQLKQNGVDIKTI